MNSEMNKRNMSKNDQPSSNNTGAILLALIGAPFALLGLVSACSVFWQFYKDIRMQFWQETSCQIVSVTLVAESGDELMVYGVAAEYRYEWTGKEFTGTRVYGMDLSKDSFKARHQRLYDELEKHRLNEAPYRCWVNPIRPSEAVLFRSGGWAQITGTSVISIMCGSIGIGLLGILAFSWNDPRTKSLTESFGNRPWMSRSDWARGEVVYSRRKNGMIVRWISIAILLITLPGAIMSGRELIDRNWLALLGLLPAGIGVLVYLKSRGSLLHWRRFGESTLRMATCPGVVGGEFRGAIRPDRLTPSPDGYEVKLKCDEIEVQTGGEGSSRSVTTLFEDQREVLKELRDEVSTLWIPVLFHIPYTAPETVLKKDFFEKTWTLTVRSLTAGHGYQADFEIPVFHTADSDEDFEPSADAFGEYIAPVDPFAAIKDSGIMVDTSVKDLCLFTFPASRHRGFAIAMLIVQAVFVGAIAGLLYYFWKPGWIPITAILAFFWLWAVLDALLYRSTVSIERQRLTVRSGLIVLGRSRIINSSDIKEWLLVPAGSWGNVTAYNLGVQLKSKSTVQLAKRILPETIAKQLKLRMKEHL